MDRRSIQTVLENLNDEASDEDGNEVDAIVFIPDPESDGSDDGSISEIDDVESDSGDEVEGGTYEFFYKDYDANQKLLEPNHVYKWVNGEWRYDKIDFDEKIFLTEVQKKFIADKNSIEVFELFFSNELKNYIIEATRANGYNLEYDRFDCFIGILITSIVNSRKSLRHYWSSDPLLRHNEISLAMKRDEFLAIKKYLKLNKELDKNLDDKAWRVRKVVDIFKENIQQFGFFSSIVSIDESMIKFYGRLIFKQYMRNKPIKFGIKLWALCTISGYLLDFDIYCGKQSNNSNEKLANCTLGTKVVMSMLHKFLSTVPKDKLKNYHACFDNYFSSPDLLVHLKKLEVKATGTVRANRVYEIQTVNNKKKRVTVAVDLDKNSSRGESDVKYDQESKINFVSVVDSKIVSVLSNAVGKTPETQSKKKSSVLFPQAFYAYNKSMGGVDLHDQHVHDLNIPIKGKKWTWYILLRLIEASISNAVVLSNLCSEKKTLVSDYAIEIANHYLYKGKIPSLKKHVLFTMVPEVRRICNKKLCSKKIPTYCMDCTKFYCFNCFNEYHCIKYHTSISQVKKGDCEDCGNRTKKFCIDCDLYFCQNCFDGTMHTNKIDNE